MENNTPGNSMIQHQEEQGFYTMVLHCTASVQLVEKTLLNFEISVQQSDLEPVRKLVYGLHLG